MSIAGFDIPGVAYVSTGNPRQGEPSVIDLKCQVGPTPVSPGEPLGYYPSYPNLTAGERATYLVWMAGGRRSADPESLDAGYLFLFFYGIERRVLIDGDRDRRLLEETLELLKLHGKSARSRSLVSYLGDFLHFAMFQRGNGEYRIFRDAIFDASDDHAGELPLALALTNLLCRGEPMRADLALRLARGHGDSKRSVLVGRAGATFVEAFRRKFEEKFPQGMPLRAAIRTKKIIYRPANASLLSLATPSGQADPFTIHIPDVYGLRSQFKALPEIWNECVGELSGFSRSTAWTHTNSSASGEVLMKKYLALPANVRAVLQHPLEEKIKGILAVMPKEDGRTFVPVRVLAEMLGLPKRPSYTSAHSKMIGELVDSLELGMAPDPRLLDLPLAAEQEVAIVCAPLGQNHEPETLGLLRLLYLSVAIAAADGTVREGEMAGYRDAVDRHLANEKIRELLVATEAALLRDTRVAQQRIAKIAKTVKPANREAVFRLLMHVASEDGMISTEERRGLLKIAASFELPATLLDGILEEDREFATVTVARSGRARKGEALPEASVPNGVAAPGFSLDMARVARIAAETEKVVGMLAEAMGEPDEELPEMVAAPLAVEVPGWMEGLDPDYAPALAALLCEAGPVTADRLREIAAIHHLIPAALVDTVNAWSDETLGDFLLEDSGDGSLTIYRDLIPEPAGHIS